LKFPKNWKKILVDYQHYSLNEQIYLPGIIKKENPDLVHFPHFNVPYYINSPFVVTIHDMLMHKQKGIKATTLNPVNYFIKRLGYKKVFEIAVKKSLKVIVPTQAVKTELESYYKINPQKLVVTNEGVDEEITKNQKGHINIQKRFGIVGNYFLYVGNSYPHKNLERAIKATILLNKNVSQKVSLVIVSARSVFIQRLETMVKNQKAKSLITIIPFVTDAELAQLYRGSVGYLFPSLSEGFGLPGLEALAIGTILVASDIPVFKEVYADNVIYFDPLSETEILKAMKKCLSLSSGQREQQIKKGQLFVKRYSWVKMAKETLKVYESCNRLRPSQ
jgi:glycosyltransferase involved in cell wall biosynthesis